MLPSKLVRVVLVDDADAIRARLGDRLRELDGVELVGEARDGEEAVHVIRSLRPDVALIDIRMPNRGGLSVLESIQDMDPRPVTIVLTNYPYGAYRDRCMQLGANHFLDKATEFDKAVEIVRGLAADYRSDA